MRPTTIARAVMAEREANRRALEALRADASTAMAVADLLSEENNNLRTLLKEAVRFYPKHDQDPRVNIIGNEIDLALAS